MPLQIFILKTIIVQRNVLHTAGFTRFHLHVLHLKFCSEVHAKSRYFKRRGQRSSAFPVGEIEHTSFMPFSYLVELGCLCS